MEKLPAHLQKYGVSQNYEQYTAIDQACWRFILRQLKAFLSVHGHPSYLDGLNKTGIEIERIPKIEDISEKLKDFGWRAIPVSGFIPPAAFMELQAHGVLPIASDMRSLEHLMYTPAPDIVHEAAGHAPMLSHPEFAQYLRQYAQVARKAIVSSEDLALYEAIRCLSDIKENPESTNQDIEAAEKKLNQAIQNITHTSEASELSRMNWWTAEYGLIGPMDDPKIFGAGLLSSVGESKWCLSSKVKKIPLSVECLKYSYDITEPQPQLFVTPDFKTLSRVLEEMASNMAFRQGGKSGLNKALKAKSVVTVQLNSGLQISGLLKSAIEDSHGQICYLQFSGPSQLSWQETQLPGHGTDFHKEGYGTAVGFWKLKPDTCPSELTPEDLASLGMIEGKSIRIEYTSEVVVQGILKNVLYKDGKLALFTFEKAEVTSKDQTLFQPEWGTYDLAIGSAIPSVFGGPADRAAYGEMDDFVAARVPARKLSEKDKVRQQQYLDLRQIRESKISGSELEKKLTPLFESHTTQFPEDWLFYLECYELAFNRTHAKDLKESLKDKLKSLQGLNESTRLSIQDGLNLAHVL